MGGYKKMDVIQGRYENELLTIAMSGHIDSNNAKDAEEKIMELHNQYPEAQIQLDAEELKYISSA